MLHIESGVHVCLSISFISGVHVNINNYYCFVWYSVISVRMEEQCMPTL